MKSTNKFTAAAVFAVLSGSLLIESCATNREFSAQGTVRSIEFGKDGYTASLEGENNKDFDALISRVRMQDGYKVLKVGDRVALSGDTIHLDNKVRVLVRKIK